MLKSIVLHAIVIVSVGAALGLGFNAVRDDVQIRLGRNYFRIAQQEPTAVADATKPDQSSAEQSQGTSPTVDADAESKPRLLPQHPFEVVELEEVAKMVGSEAAYNGSIVFVDARNAADYEEGHIPGAYHIDNYNVERYLPEVRPLIEFAETIVVYCGGGECEDSIFLASELEARGFRRDAIRLFEAGMAAWRDADMPIETGSDPVTAGEAGFTDASVPDEEISTP
jgi:rhodanese-related sulfurtransferase